MSVSDVETQHAAGEVLRHRLSRNASRGGQIGCSIAIGLFLGVIAAAILRYPLVHPDENDLWLLYAIGGLLAAIALLLLYSGIHQIFASKTPETVVEIDSLLLKRGAPVKLFFRQPGPVTLESLRANLVGEETWSVTRGTGENHRVSHESKYLGTFNFFDSGAVSIEEEVPLQQTTVFHVPDDIQKSGSVDGHTTKWKIEVWGKVKGRADFMHAYEIEVV